MCGRSSLTKTEKELEKRFQATFYSEELERYNPLPNYNVAPTSMCPVIINKDKNHFHIFRWGLVPFWAKDLKIGASMINARMETVLEKPAFRQAVKSRRCLVPMDGFYEWKRSATQKTPYRIQVADTDIFAAAGLWEEWHQPGGNPVFTFTVLTTDANAFMQPIHDRMPVILNIEQESLWLDDDISPAELLRQIPPFPSERMKAYRVSDKVNNVRNNDPSLILPVEGV